MNLTAEEGEYPNFPQARRVAADDYEDRPRALARWRGRDERHRLDIGAARRRCRVGMEVPLPEIIRPLVPQLAEILIYSVHAPVEPGAASSGIWRRPGRRTDNGAG